MKRKRTSFLVMAIAFSSAAPILWGEEIPERVEKIASTDVKKPVKRSAAKKAEVKTVERFISLVLEDQVGNFCVFVNDINS